MDTRLTLTKLGEILDDLTTEAMDRVILRCAILRDASWQMRGRMPI